MREVKFRIWDGKNMFPLRLWDFAHGFLEVKTGYGPWRLHKETDIADYNEGPDEEDVEIMQYTGLKDKNEKEIYEGDIVRCHVDNEAEDYLHLEAKGGHVVRTISIPETYQEGLPDNCEVIGNIHENLELLNPGSKTAEKK